jgi:tetratricopeptide (TPR) repeat protein
MAAGDRSVQRDNFEAARPAYVSAIRAAEQSSDDLKQGRAWNRLGATDMRLRRYSEANVELQNALDLFERSAGTESPDFADALEHLAILNFRQGKFDEAEKQYRRVLEIERRTVGEHDGHFGQTLNRLAEVFIVRHRLSEAGRFAHRALGILTDAYGPDDLRLVPVLDNLSLISADNRRFDIAMDFADQSYRLLSKRFGERNPYTAQRAVNRAVALAGAGRIEEARDLARTSLDIQLAALGENSPEVALTMANLAAFDYRAVQAGAKHSKLSKQEMSARCEQDIDLFDRAARTLEGIGGQYQDDLARVLVNYAELLRDVGRKADAKRAEARARAVVGGTEDYGRYTVDVSALRAR